MTNFNGIVDEILAQVMYNTVKLIIVRTTFAVVYSKLGMYAVQANMYTKM